VGSDIGLGFAALNFMSEHRRIAYMDDMCMADAAPNLPFSYSEHSGQSLRPEALGQCLYIQVQIYSTILGSLRDCTD